MQPTTCNQSSARCRHKTIAAQHIAVPRRKGGTAHLLLHTLSHTCQQPRGCLTQAQHPAIGCSQAMHRRTHTQGFIKCQIGLACISTGRWCPHVTNYVRLVRSSQRTHMMRTMQCACTTGHRSGLHSPALIGVGVCHNNCSRARHTPSKTPIKVLLPHNRQHSSQLHACCTPE
jgi:hypothetical protein